MGAIELFTAFVFIIPYNILGIDLANQLILVAGSAYILAFRKKIRPDRLFAAMLSIIAVSFVLTAFSAGGIMGSIGGLAGYLNIPVYYLVVKSLKDSREKVFASMYCSVVLVAFLAVLIEGILMDRRIQGSFTYSNSFALLLLAAVFISGFIPSRKTFAFGGILLFSGIFFTGSRTTIFLTVVYLIVRLLLKAGAERVFWDIYDFSGALLLYLSSQYSKLAIFILFAALLLLRNYLKRKKADLSWLRMPNLIKGALLAACIAACAVILAVSGTSLGVRLGTVSLNTGELQERFVIFQDAFRHVVKHPLGSGINSFEYLQYLEQSAFYDVRFIHDSILQIAYDLGVVPALSAVVLLVAGIIHVYKSKATDRYFVCIFLLMLIFHSLLDFDFSFSTLSILLMMLFVFWETAPSANAGTTKPAALWISGAGLALGFYLAVCSLTVFAADSFASRDDCSNAISMAELNSRITFGNARTHTLIAQYYRQLAVSPANGEPDRSLLEECKKHLAIAERLNPLDVRIKINMAFILSGLGEIENADAYYSESIKNQRFNPGLYDAYFEFLASEKPEKIKWLEEYKAQSGLLLNSRAVFLKDQITPAVTESR